MARDLFTNQGSTTVSSGGTTAPAAGTTESWTVASSSAFPTASATDYPATQFYVADPAAPTELILVTNVNGTTWDVTRGADGTTPVAHSAGFTVKNIVTADWLQRVSNRFNQEVLSVKDFGAKGDNSTNDLPAFQAALDAAWRMGGAQVVVPRGIYRIMGYSGTMRIRSNTRLTLLPGAEVHRYCDASSLVWNGDYQLNSVLQNRAGWLAHGNITIEGGTWDMRSSNSTHGCTTVSAGGTTAPAAGTADTLTVDLSNSGQPNLGFPTAPFFIYDPAAPTEVMRVNSVSYNFDTPSSSTMSVTRGASGTPVVHSAGWIARVSDMALAADDFNRSNTSAPHTLGAMSLSGVAQGITWIDETSRGTSNQGTGNLGISSSGAYAPVALTDGNIASTNAWPDGSVNATISTVGNAGIVFRLANSQNYWKYVRHTDGNARLSVVVNSVETVITPTATTAVSAGSVLRVVFYGSTVRAYVGTTLTHDTTDSYHTANRKTGLIIFDTTARVDNFTSSAAIWQDDFARANSTTTPGSAGNLMSWTEQSGNLGISSSAVYAPGAGTNIATLPVTQETNPEIIMSTAGNAGIVFRYKDNNNYWAYVRHTDTNARLIKVVNGSTTVQTVETTKAVASGDVMRVCVNGYSIRCYTDATRTHDIIDPDLYQEKMSGVIIYDTTARIYNYKAVVSWGGSTSGACLNFGHGEQILFRDTVIRDNSANSHAIEIAGCKNVLCDNVTFQGMSPVYGRFSEAFQMDLLKSGSYFGAFGPYDQTTNRDVILRGCSFTLSNMPGTAAWQRGVGSHSGTVGVWHDHLRVTDCFFEVSQKAVRAFNWNNVIIRGNTIRSGEGIEVRVIDPTSLSDTVNNAGTTTSASQPIQNIQVEGNIVTCDRAAIGSVYAIHLVGEIPGGSIQGAVVANNDIRSTTCGGIGLEHCYGATVANNIVNSLMAADSGGAHGIRLLTCQDTTVNGNSIFRSNANGIYITGTTTPSVTASSRVQITNNYIRGVNRSNAATGNNIAAIKGDGTPTDITLSDNVFRLWGSGGEAAWAVYFSNGSNIRRTTNDWATGLVGDILIPAASDAGNVIAWTRTNDSGAVTLNTYQIVSGMTIPINTPGMYRITAHCNFTMSAATGCRYSIGGTANNNSTGTPTTTMLAYTVSIQTNPTTGATSVLSGSGYCTNTTNSSNISTAGTGTIYSATLIGYAVFTSTGTISLQGATGSGNFVTKTGSTFMVERIVG